MAYILNYTREPVNEVIYDPRLAYSMHLAVSEDGKEYRALNHNSGILFVKATENADGSLNPKSLKNPWLFALPDGRFGVAGIRIEGDGGEDEESRGCAVF
ncbi:MAG: glycosyl hydrolase, partial [Acetatifactor sp.]|nr:glycosyl hydrolase [Acetatifactor sp.]